MVERAAYSYDPDYAVPPGETLLETLEAVGMSQAELARRTDRPVKTINEIVKGKASITPDTATQLETVLGVPASFWNNAERVFRERLARLEEKRRLERYSRWLSGSGIPVRQMVKLGWIARQRDRIDTTRAVLRYFGVTSPESFEAVYGRSGAGYRMGGAFECGAGSLAAWLRKGEIGALGIRCGSFDKAGFASVLAEIAKLSRREPADYLAEIQRVCAPAGVAVVYVPSLPNCPVSGASRWLTSDKALVQLAARSMKDDHFWFTFFHEAGHIVIHNRDSKKAIYLDDRSWEADGGKEKQANRFARDMLVPRAQLRRIEEILAERKPDESLIERIAADLGVCPGIIVGRLQLEGFVPFESRLNRLKRDIELG
jgi:HTH-type transcriptional regulator/antitoxin HigA